MKEKAGEKSKSSPKSKARRRPEYTETGGLDYSVYYMRHGEWLLYFLLAAAGLFALGYIFYRDLIISGALALFAFRFPSLQKKALIEKRRKKLTLQFKDMLYSLSSAIGSGSSPERAMNIVLTDMRRQYVNPDTYIIRELELIVSKLGMNANIEDLFADLAERSGIEDIKMFAAMFDIAKLTGGNMIQIIRQTSDIITQKIETSNEIDTLLAAKQFEQKIMTAAPVLFLYLLTETTGEFMAPLFADWKGHFLCTVALILVVVGHFWSKKIADIKI